MRGYPSLFADFSGGLNSLVAPYLLEYNQARDLLNVQSLEQGGITKRNGLVTFAELDGPLHSLYGVEVTGTPTLVGAGGGSIFAIDGTGRVTEIARSLSRTARWEWVQASSSDRQGPLFGVNGSDTPQQWDGSSGATAAWSASSGTLPNGRYVVLHHNFIYMAGMASQPSRLAWCDVEANVGTKATVWPADHVVELEPDDGDRITGLGKAGDLLLVFKRRKLFAIYDSATGANRRISDSVGCIAHRSIVETPAGTFFLAEDGVRRTDGSAVDPTPVSRAIEPTIKSLLADDAAAVFYDNHYYLSFPSDGVVFDYDLVAGSWWRHSISASQWALLENTLYSAKANIGIVDRAFVEGVYTDNGSPVRWYWKGPWLSPGADLRRTRPTPYHRKRWRQVRVEGSGVVDFSIAKDFALEETLIRDSIFAIDSGEMFGGGGVFGGDGVFGGGPNVQRADMYSLGVARVLSVVVGATSEDPGSVFSMTHFTTDRRN